MRPQDPRFFIPRATMFRHLAKCRGACYNLQSL